MRVVKYNIMLNDDKKAELIKESSANYPELARSLSDPSDIRDFAKAVFRADRMAEEYVWAIATDFHLHPIGVFEISHGSDRTSLLNEREVFTRLFLCGAGSFFLVHNHPSGDIFPSQEDIDATKRIFNGGELLGIQLKDHVIVGSNLEYYSFHKSMPEIFQWVNENQTYFACKKACVYLSTIIGTLYLMTKVTSISVPTSIKQKDTLI